MEQTTAHLNVELPVDLIAKVKQEAADRGILLRRFVQDALKAQVEKNGKQAKS